MFRRKRRRERKRRQDLLINKFPPCTACRSGYVYFFDVEIAEWVRVTCLVCEGRCYIRQGVHTGLRG